MSIDHVLIPVPASKFDAEVAFLLAALAPLGIVEQMRPVPCVVGLGPAPDKAKFWVSGFNSDQTKILAEGEEDQAGRVGVRIQPVHVAFTGKNREEVDAFYEAGIKAGGTDFGKPGLRTMYHPGYYGAFVLSPCGHNIEAVIHHGNQ